MPGAANLFESSRNSLMARVLSRSATPGSGGEGGRFPRSRIPGSHATSWDFSRYVSRHGAWLFEDSSPHNREKTMIHRAEIQKSVLVALVGSLFFAALFLLAAHQALAGNPASTSGPASSVSAVAPTTAPASGSAPTSAPTVIREVPGEMGGWMRSGPFTLVIRGGAYPGTRELELRPTEETSCLVLPDAFEAHGILLRCEMPLDTPIKVVHTRSDDKVEELSAERFVDRGYAQVAVKSFGEFRFVPHSR